MMVGAWRGGVAVLCLAFGLWACQPGFSSPDQLQAPAPVSPTIATQMPSASALFTPGNPAAATSLPTSAAPTRSPATPVPSETPPVAIDASLVAHYAPWSLGHAVAWSPDGNTLAVSAGESVYFYTGGSLQEQGRIDLGAWGAAIAFSPADPGLLAVAGRDGALQLWDVAQRKRLAYQFAHARGAVSVVFSPDGSYLASSGSDPMVRLWLVAALLTGHEVKPLAAMIGGAVAVPAVRYSPDGKLIASIDLSKIRLRDSLTQRLAQTLNAGTSMFTLAFSPDGQLLAVGELGSHVRLWSVASGTESLLLRADAGNADAGRAFVWSLGFNADGDLLAAGSSAGTLTVWSLPGGEVIRVIPAHSKAVSGLAFDPLGQRVATCGLDAALRIWSIP